MKETGKATLCVLLSMSIILGGCAGRQANPIPVYLPGDENRTCEAYLTEIAQLEADMERIVPNTNKLAYNSAMFVGGLFLIAPFFFMDLKNADKVEWEAMRVRRNRLVVYAKEKGCDFGGKEPVPIPSLEEMRRMAKDKSRAGQSVKATTPDSTTITTGSAAADKTAHVDTASRAAARDLTTSPRSSEVQAFTPQTKNKQYVLRVTIKGKITNMAEARQYVLPDSYIQLVRVPANGDFGLEGSTQGRMVFVSDLARTSISEDGAFSLFAEKLKVGKYLVSAQQLRPHGLGVGGSGFLAKPTVSGETKAQIIEVVQGPQDELTIDLGAVMIPVPTRSVRDDARQESAPAPTNAAAKDQVAPSQAADKVLYRDAATPPISSTAPVFAITTAQSEAGPSQVTPKATEPVLTNTTPSREDKYAKEASTSAPKGMSGTFNPPDTSNSPKPPLAAVKISDKWGFVDRQGTTIIKPTHDNASGFSQGMASVSVKGKWGYVDESGALAVNPAYDFAGSFSGGLGCVRLDGLCGYIDKSGKEVIKRQFTQAERFAGGLAAVKTPPFLWSLMGGAWQFIDTKGEKAIPVTPLPGGQLNFSNGRPSLDIILPSFHDGLAWVQTANGSGFIDKTGQFKVIPDAPQPVGWYADGRPAQPVFSEGLCWITNKDGKYGAVDKSGKIVIDCQFDVACPFSQGLAAVKIGNKWGFVDTKGKLLIPAEFNEVGPFAEGLAPVKSADGWGYINTAGRIVVQPAYTRVHPFLRSTAFVQTKAKWRLIDTQGRVLTESAFDDVDDDESDAADADGGNS